MSKQVLFIDAVNWSEQYDPSHPLRNVGSWFVRHVPSNTDIESVVRRADDVFNEDPKALANIAQGMDAVVMSGSPRDAWSTEDPINSALCEVVLDCQKREIPFLGVCYGHQIMGRALGARVDRNPKGWEVGLCHVNLTEAGQKHRLFKGLPSRLPVIQSHLDAVLDLPPGCEPLATTEHTVQQSYHWNNLLHGVQFHPEMDPEVLRYLWGPRRILWRDKVDFDLDQSLDDMAPATESAKVLRNFLEMI